LTEAQAGGQWRPPVGPLGELTRDAVERARAAAPERARLEGAIARLGPVPAFAAALRGPHVRVIAELKRRSPSKGAINEGLEAASRAVEYERGGAAALSVLTEPRRFGGSLEDLAAVRRAVGLPLIRKDFIVAPIQLLEARAHGASAVLLIARALEPSRLSELAAEAGAIGLECLVETRDERELERAIAVPGAVIGVNNRDLETLVIDDEVGRRIMPMIPPDRIAVYESGITCVADIERAASIGADAVLVGSMLSVAADGVSVVRALTAVRRRSRG
jgi:indole-3-glycerol phosphate synthase